MVIDVESALRAVTIVLENKEANRTTKGSLESCLITAVGTFLGSMTGGPKGIIPGALLGAGVAYLMKKDDYKSIIAVINEDLSFQERQALAWNVQKVISSFNIADVAMLMIMASHNENFQREILKCVNSVVDSHIS